MSGNYWNVTGIRSFSHINGSYFRFPLEIWVEFQVIDSQGTDPPC